MADRPEIRVFKQGEVLLHEGDTFKEAYLLRTGFVTAYSDSSGNRVALGTRMAGEFVGEMALYDDSCCSATVEAGEDLEAEVITREHFEALLSETPPLIVDMMAQVMDSLRNTDDLVSMYASISQGEPDA